MELDKKNKNREKIDFGAILGNYRKHWWWFVISIVLCLGLSVLYLRIKSPLYLVKTLVMFNQDEEESAGAIGGLGALMSSFSIGGSGGSLIEDEMMKMGSHTNMTAVVKQLDMNRNYWSKAGLFSPKVWYFENSPITVEIPDAVLDTISVTTEFSIDVPANGLCMSIEVRQGDLGTVLDAEIDGLPYMAKTPYGIFRVDTTEYFIKGDALKFKAVVMNNNVVVEDLNDRMAISQLSKKANAVQVDIEDVNIERGRKFLNTLVASYNERGIADKNEVALSTARFIEERLLKLYGELETTETDIENYKSKNQIVDAVAEAEYTFVRKERIETGMLELETQSAVLQMIKDFLMSPDNKYSLVPFTADFPEEPITAYNELVLQYITLGTSAKKNNSTLKNLMAQIDAMRGNVITTIDKSLQSTRIALADMRREAANSERRMVGIPRMERELTALYRDQIIKNEIYSFMLQKREENELKLSRNTPKGKVVDAAYAESKPISPKKIMVLAMGLIMGILIPVVLLKYLNPAGTRGDMPEETEE